jgi:hypothetical protein
VGESEAKKGPGSDLFSIFFVVFLNSPHRETPKNVIKKIDKKSVWDFVTIFLQNVCCCIFELPSLRNTLNRDKPKKVEEKLTSKILPIFWGKVFDMGLFTKILFVVLLNAQKPTKNKRQEKKSRLVGGWVWD